VSSRKERDRYRGRRRVPTPPRSRYAAVATTALIGAGVVAMATAAAMPDMKVADPGSLASMSGNSISAPRLSTADRANRSNDRTASTSTDGTDVWLLPMTSYTITTPFGERPGVMQKGIDLAAPEGTPFYASHGGTVTLARWHGGYGYTVIIDVGDGTELVYGHASKLLVHEGQKINSGDLLALTGSTGYSFAPHVHFEVRKDGTAVDPAAFLFDHGVNIKSHHDSLTP
jgi:murein DD-endopeptidase MepM/ murein hydrolase activator NlpD